MYMRDIVMAKMEEEFLGGLTTSTAISDVKMLQQALAEAKIEVCKVELPAHPI
jgi:hypothetical protein